MSTTRARPQSPAIYRRRRLVLLLVLLLVVAGIALAVWQPWSGRADPEQSNPSASTAAAPAPTEEAPDETPEPVETEATPDPSATSGIAACASRDIVVRALTDKAEYGPGENPQLTVELTNDGTVTCYLNVGTAQQSFVITSGNDTWWRSTDCQTDPSDLVVQLQPGQRVASVAPLVWDRTRSYSDTCEGARPAALAGTYNLAVTVGGVNSAEPTRFVLR